MRRVSAVAGPPLLALRHASTKTFGRQPIASGSTLPPALLKPHPELSSLPKATTALRSLRFKNVLPGSSESIIYPGKQWNPKKVLEPRHAAVKQSPREFPRYSCPLFTMRAFPSVLMQPFDKNAYPFPQGSKRKEREAKDAARHTIHHANMGMVCIVGKKGVHPSAVIRVRVKLRMKEAIRLVVARGAETDPSGTLKLDDKQCGEERWLMKDWAYTFHPTLEMYRHPIEGVITEVRKALRRIKEEGQTIERQWTSRQPIHQPRQAVPPIRKQLANTLPPRSSPLRQTLVGRPSPPAGAEKPRQPKQRVLLVPGVLAKRAAA